MKHTFPRSADTLEDARTLALHYQSIAAQQGNKIMRLRTALLILREFGGLGHGYHGGVMAVISRWLDGGMDGPILWPDSPFFASWATDQGMSNVDGAVGYRLKFKLPMAKAGTP
jgi:hypothetical protein